jgi:hypothetical protein
MGKDAQLKSGNARDGRIVEIWEENEIVRGRKDSVQFVVQITVARAEACSRVKLENRN